MSVSLLKLIAAQRLLADTRELLEREVLAASLRTEGEDRVDSLRLNADHSETGQTNCLEILLRENRKFGTIYADPPWHYANVASRGAASATSPRWSSACPPR